MTETATAPSRDEVTARLRTLLADMLGLPVDTLTGESKLFDELGLDSTNALELLLVIEDEFDVEFDPAALEQDHLSTVDTLTAYLVDQAGI